MHRLYVVAFPEIGADDAAKVEALRAAHDSAGHALLRAHFTFVFGCIGVSVEAAERAMQAVACEMRSIEFCLTRAVTSVHSNLHYVFLCPEQGATAMIELHARLHAGPLAACIDPTQAFTPHLTVCKTADPGEAGQVLAQITRGGLRIRGALRALSLGALQDGKFERLRDIALTGTVKG